MKFFIPHAQDEQQQDSVYTNIKKFVKEQTGWEISSRKISSIRYRHEGKDYTATVGQVEERQGEEVIAILDSTTYLICTPNRGVIRGGPILVGKNETHSVVDFDK